MSAQAPTDLTDAIAVRTEQTGRPDISRDEAIAAIRAALRRRSGKSWSVKGGRGTAWGWITISAPPARCDEYGAMCDEDRAELGELLSIGRPVHPEGESVAASTNYRIEFVARAEGRKPSRHGSQYWD